MNRVLNKDFGVKSCNNSTLIAFSDVFHPACCMQTCPALIPGNRRQLSPGIYAPGMNNPAVPAKENLMRSGNAC